VLEVIPERVAVILVEAGREAIPGYLASPALFMVATVVSEECQLTDVVKSCSLPSLNVPLAVNCFSAFALIWRLILKSAGDTVIDTN
jgi:hypothetical protein